MTRFSVNSKKWGKGKVLLAGQTYHTFEYRRWTEIWIFKMTGRAIPPKVTFFAFKFWKNVHQARCNAVKLCPAEGSPHVAETFNAIPTSAAWQTLPEYPFDLDEEDQRGRPETRLTSSWAGAPRKVLFFFYIKRLSKANRWLCIF